MKLDPRVRLALERTLLSWIRTSIALIGFGFLVSRLSFPLEQANSQLSLWIGIGLIFTGIFVNFAASHSFKKNLRLLEQGQGIETGEWPLGRVLSVLISVLSIALIIHLVFHH